MSRHDTLKATWQPGQCWQTRLDECAQDENAWTPVGNGGRSEPAWDERQEYRQRPEAEAQSVSVDRDSDGELLIDWSPGPGRMVTLSLRADGRLSYAFTWDGEKAHGVEQMPAALPLPQSQAAEQLLRWHDYMAFLMQKAGVQSSDVIAELYRAYAAAASLAGGSQDRTAAVRVIARLLALHEHMTADDARTEAARLLDADAAALHSVRSQEAETKPVAEIAKDIMEHVANAPNEADCAMCKGRGFYGIPGGRCTFCDGTGKVRWRSQEAETKKKESGRG